MKPIEATKLKIFLDKEMRRCREEIEERIRRFEICKMLLSVLEDKE